MAESKIQIPRDGIHTAYAGSGTYSNDIGRSITCNFDLRRFSWVELMVFAGSIEGAKRRYILVPVFYHNLNAGYWSYATPTSVETIRLETSNNTITLISCTESSLYVAGIYVLD